MARVPYLRCLTVLVLLSAAPPMLHGQCVGTPVSGTIQNTTWPLPGSPYCVIGDLSLTNLRIDPGVVVQIDGDYTINVRAGLRALGTSAAPIRFTSSTLDWNGIRFVNSSSNCFMDHCIVEKADQPGITVVNSLPKITNSTIQENRATLFGGGMRIEVSTGHFSLKGCTIRNNRSATHGGGMYINMDGGFTCVLRDCVVQDNVVNESLGCGSFVGGGIYFAPTNGNLVTSGCLFSGNCVNSIAGFNCFATVALGGALYADSGNVAITNCEFRGNWSRGHDDNFFGDGRGRGAGIYFAGASSVLDIRCSTFACNSSLVPTTNEASGSSIYLESGAAALLNCTLARNGVVWPGSPDPTFYNLGGTATLRNSILYWNNPGEPSGACAGAITYGAQIGGPGVTAVTFSDVQGGFPGNGNISADPIFTDDGDLNCDANLKPDCGSLDLSLVFPGSPCVDAGNPGSTARDSCLPPSKGTVRNDMGFTGGPQACPNSSPAMVTSRNGGLNQNTYTATKIIIGQKWCATVACPSTGQPIYAIAFYDAPLRVTVPPGYVVLVDISRPKKAYFGPATCGTTLCVDVPSNMSLVGCAVYSQAAHIGTRPPALSNALDFIIGTY